MSSLHRAVDSLFGFLASACLVLLSACAGSHHGVVACMTSDGHGLVAGESVPGDTCRVCDGSSARILPRHGAGCGTSVDYVFPRTSVSVLGDLLKVSGDVNGDHIPDLLIGAYATIFTDGSSWPGRVQIIDLKTGELLYLLEGTEEHPVGGAEDLRDVDGDGIAELLYVESMGPTAGAIGREGSPDDPDIRPNVIHVRSLATGDDLWTLDGLGGCHALGALAMFVPDYDDDGRLDVLLFDPVCVMSYNHGIPMYQQAGLLELVSGIDGRVIRTWTPPTPSVIPVSFDVPRHLGLVSDIDGDALPDIVFTSGPMYAELLFSVQMDEPIARWTRRGFGLPGDPSYAQDITNDGDLNRVSLSADTRGEVTLNVYSQLGATEPTTDSVRFHVPGASHERHAVTYAGHGDADGDGAEEVLFFDLDSAVASGLLNTHLVAVDLEGHVTWVSESPVGSVPIVGGVLDLDGDGREDFVTLKTTTGSNDTIHLELSTGFADGAP